MSASRVKLIVFMVLILVLLANAAALWPETRISSIDLNDNVFHYTLVERIVQAVRSGENPLDCWSPEWSFGFPVLRIYQPLAHLLVAAVWFLLGKSVSLMNVFIAIRFLSIALLPLTFFWTARAFGLSLWTAAAAAILSPLISTNFLYGIEYGSFTWAGSGLFPQAVATHLLLLSLAAGWRAITEGRRALLAGVLVGATLLAHLIYGYIAAISLVLLAALPNAGAPLALRARRLLAIGASAFAISAFQLLPLLRDASLINHSRWEPSWKWDSFGAAAVLQRVFTGELLDHDRLPILTVLAFLGVALLAWDRWRSRAQAAHLYLALGAAFWLLLFFGRPFWGSLLPVLGVSDDMHLHRVVGGAQAFLVLLAAVALSRLWSELAARRQYLAAAAATALLVYPMAAERARNLSNNALWGRRSLERYEAERRDLEAAVASAKAAGGRAYAGRPAAWGGQFKVGDVPFYAFLSTAQVPALAFLYHSMALTGDLMVRFNDQWPAQYRLFNVGAVITPDPAVFAPPGMLRERAQFGRFHVYDAPGNGYFDIVDADAVVRVTRRSFYDVNDRWLRGDWPVKRAHLLLEFRDPAPAGLTRIAADAPLPFLAAPPPDPGRVVAERQDGPQVYAAETDTTRPAYALFKMTWHPDWNAYVDGARRPVVMLSPGFSGVALGPGRHRVEFRYEPGPSKPLLALAGLALLLLAAWRGASVARRLDALSRALAPRRLAISGAAAVAVLAVAALVLPASRGAAAAGMLALVIVLLAAWPGAGAPRRLDALSRALAPSRLAVAAGLFALALPVAVPLFSSGVLWGHDAFEYFPRVIEVHRNLQHGILLPRWAPDLGSGAGQPLFIFHPPLFYWIGELWNLAGFDPVTAVNLAAALVVFASAAAMFLLGRLWFGRIGGWLAAAAYLYAPYFAVDLYVRSAMEEFTAFPLAAFSLYGFGVHARTASKRHWILGAASFAAILFAHFPAALLFAPLLLAYLALTAWLARSWRAAAMQAAGFVLGLALAAWSWIPALLERQHVAIGRTLEGHLRFTNHFVYLQQLIYSPWGYGLSVPGPADGMSFTLGWAHILLAAVAALWAAGRLKSGARALVRFCAAAAILLCLLMSSESFWLWERLPLLAYVEYPWRLLQPVTLCLALLIAALGPALEALPRYRSAAIAAVLALLIVPGLARLRPPRVADVDLALWTPDRIASSGFESTTAGEITPRWVLRSPPPSPRAASVAAGDAEIAEASVSPFDWSGRVRARTPSTIEIARAFYPGWSVRVDGADVDPSPADVTGRLQFRVEPGEHDVQVEWGRSPARRSGEWISLIAIVVAAAVVRGNRRA